MRFAIPSKPEIEGGAQLFRRLHQGPVQQALQAKFARTVL